MHKLIRYFRPFIPHIALTIALLFVQAMTELALPEIMSQIVDKGVAVARPGFDTSAYIWQRGGVMLAYALTGAVCIVCVGLLSSWTAAGVARNLRSDVFKRVLSYSIHEFESFSTASLITRSTNDIQQIQHMSVMMLRILFYAPILGIGGIFRVLNQHRSMTWIIAVAVFVLLCLVLAMFFIAMPRFRALQKLVDRLNLVAREMLSGLLVIRAFSTNPQQEKKFRLVNRELSDTHLFVNRLMVFMMPAMMLIMNGITLLIVWTGAHLVDSRQIMVGDMMAFIQYTMQIIMAFLMVSFGFIMFPRASVAASRLAEILAVQSSVGDPPDPVSLGDNTSGSLRFENVSFRYPQAEEYALRNITFQLSPGQTTALTGSTGSGKSTLAHLILRFFDVSDGKIVFNDLDIRSIRQKELRANIGFVPQQTALLSGTIRSNLNYGNPAADDKELLTSARIAQACDFIMESEAQLDSAVAQSGSNFSGGQKQRLAIARALAKNPPILIFDDSFSALDYQTDARLRQALRDQTRNKAVLLISQRIATIRGADQILVLDKGRLVAQGTHADLLKTSTVYQEIAASQLTRKELLQ